MENPRKESTASPDRQLPKAATGISGLDEITQGGFPRGRPTLVSGGAGAGKTMLGLEFLVRGATEFNEPGVCLMFEESAAELAANVRSLGFDLESLCDQNLLHLDHIHIERSEIEETGEYDLEGLFIRLGHAVQRVGAKRVMLDTLEALFAGLPNHAILRAELRRLFRWLKDRGLTAVITGERGEKTLTRYGLEEYVADCVIVLDHRVSDQISTRRLRVAKYRGTAHGTNEYPFLIGSRGISVLPITSLTLDHKVSTERVSSGVPAIDEMLGGQGFFRGTSVLVSGTPGTGKSSIAATFAAAACRRNESAVLFAFEESAAQIIRNMRSIGIDLEPFLQQGLLKIHSSRPTLQGLEQHLMMMHDEVAAFRPSVVIVDPISNLSLDADKSGLKPTLMRIVDFLKDQQITSLFTSLTEGGQPLEDSQLGVSSLMDTWLLLRNSEYNGERNRTIYILKSRGMSHSNQIREFQMTDNGIDLANVYLGNDRVLTGTARLAQEASERAAMLRNHQEHERRLRELRARQQALQAQIAALQLEAENVAAEAEFAAAQADFEGEQGRDAVRLMSEKRER